MSWCGQIALEINFPIFMSHAIKRVGKSLLCNTTLNAKISLAHTICCRPYASIYLVVIEWELERVSHHTWCYRTSHEDHSDQHGPPFLIPHSMSMVLIAPKSVWSTTSLEQPLLNSTSRQPSFFTKQPPTNLIHKAEPSK
jgi:hypothetical protein